MNKTVEYSLPASVFKSLHTLFKGADTIRITPTAIGWSMTVLSTDKTYITSVTVPVGMFSSYVQGGELCISVNDLALVGRLKGDVTLYPGEGTVLCRAGRSALDIPLYSDDSAPPKVPSCDYTFSAVLSSDDIDECIASAGVLDAPFIRFDYDANESGTLTVSCAAPVESRKYWVEIDVNGGDYAARAAYSAETVASFIKAVGKGMLTISYSTDYPMEITADRGYVVKLMVAPRVGD